MTKRREQWVVVQVGDRNLFFFHSLRDGNRDVAGAGATAP